MVEVLGRLLEFLAILWLARVILRNLFSSGSAPRADGSQAGQPGSRSSRRASEPSVISGGEMKKDPQCGTYVATEVSFKTTSGGETLHFCSRECQEQYLQAHSIKPA